MDLLEQVDKKGGTNIGYRDTRNTTTATLVHLSARSKGPIQGIAILRPHPSHDDEYDGDLQLKD